MPKSAEELKQLANIIRTNAAAGKSASYEACQTLPEGGENLTFEDFTTAKNMATNGSDERAVPVSREASKTNPRLYQNAKAKAATIPGGFVEWVD